MARHSPRFTLAFAPYALPLGREWRSAAGGLEVRRGWLLRLEDDEGSIGYGDCAPLAGIGCESEAAAAAALAHWRHNLEGKNREGFLAALGTPQAWAAPAARAALECALLDLLARRRGRSLGAHLGNGDGQGSVGVNASLGTLGAETEAALERALEAGFSIHKLKVGMAPASQEIQRVEALCMRLPAGHALRLDANRAWDESTARRWLAALAGLPIDALEEPLARPDAAAWAALQAGAAFPLAVDESLGEWPRAALFDGTVHRLVLKLPRLGGLLPALALARRFAAAGGDCIITSSLESACGLLAAAHLAAALGGGLAHGLGTAEWLAADLGTPPVIRAGRLFLPGGPGLGFVPLD